MFSKFLKRLPDTGEKIKTYIRQLEDEIAAREEMKTMTEELEHLGLEGRKGLVSLKSSQVYGSTPVMDSDDEDCGQVSTDPSTRDGETRDELLNSVPLEHQKLEAVRKKISQISPKVY